LKLWLWLKRLFHRKKIDWEAERAGYSQQAQADDERNKLAPEEEKDVAIAEKEIAAGKAKTFDNVDDLLADLHRTRSVHTVVPKAGGQATRQDVGKFMKHGRQAPYYRKSVKAKVKPEDED